MAVDTAAKRLSMLGFGDIHAFGVTPTGTVDAEARASFLDLYQGIAIGFNVVSPDPERTLTVGADGRSLTVGASTRTLTVSDNSRTFVVASEITRSD